MYILMQYKPNKMEAYTLWKNYRALADLIKNDSSLNERDCYEMRNIIERFILSERQATPATYGDILTKMRDELREKRLPAMWYDKITAHLNPHVGAKPIQQGNRFTFGECSFTLDTKRLAAIAAYPNYNPMDVVTLYLRYDTGTNGSQQWSIPPTFYSAAHAQLSATYSVVEGCASLFNSNMLVVGATTPTTPCYCSLEPLEAKYGSLGRLDTALPCTKTLGDKPVFWIVNPPFIESVMVDLGAMVLAHAEQFFWIMPYWADSKAYTQFADKVSERGITVKILRKKTYNYWNGTKLILANFDSVIFTTTPNLIALL